MTVCDNVPTNLLLNLSFLLGPPYRRLLLLTVLANCLSFRLGLLPPL